jgi:hypothetical protein
MPRKLLLLLLVSAILSGSTAALADGDMYTGDPLGTRITSLPCTIKVPGHYYLGGSLSYHRNAITIDSDDVTLDLMGHTLTGPGVSGGGFYAVYIKENRKNVEIRNGKLTRWYAGVYSDNGAAHRIINVRSVDNYIGFLLDGHGCLIQGCLAEGTGSGIGFTIGNGSGAEQSNSVVGCCSTQHNNGISANGRIIGNVVIGTGITFSRGIEALTFGPALVMGNKVSNCYSGIICWGSGSVIGNTVNTPTDDSGGITVLNVPTTVVDQNTVLGPSTLPYSNHDHVAWRTNN